MADRTTHYRLNKPTVAEAMDISDLNENMDIIDGELYGRVKSLNGNTPDENGNVEMNTVPLAENLTSSYNQTSQESFVIRTTSGASSVNDGDGTLESIMGGRVREGYVPYKLVKTETHAQRDEDEDDFIASVDDDVFLSRGVAGGTISFTYEGGWSVTPSQPSGEDPLAWYGVSVLGTAKSGDEIVLNYTEAVLGTIIQSTPTAFVSTGWNLYNHQMQYARVVRYSETQGYRITGSYSSIRFSSTQNGERRVITPDANGNFNVPSAGYIWVSGGNNTNTAIWATWGDWSGNYVGDFEVYKEHRIDLSAIMTAYFPNGLMQVGNYRDEINFSTGIATKSIDRFERDSQDTAIANAKMNGQQYEYDTNYVYVVRMTAETHPVSIDNSYTMNDHGTELFADTDVPVVARTIYGANLKNKLERDVLTISAQELSDTQKEQVRENIGAAPADLADTLSQVIDGLFKIVTYKFTITSTSANGYKSITAEELGVTAIEGYRLVAFTEVYCGNHYLVISRISPATTGSVITVHNTSSSSVSAKTVTVTALWVKESAIAV